MPNVVDYDDGLPSESIVLYYQTSDDEIRKMFPADPHVGHSRITSNVATTRRAQFNNDVAERDGRKCVLTSTEEMICEAVHLLAHSKAMRYAALTLNLSSLTIVTEAVHIDLHSPS